MTTLKVVRGALALSLLVAAGCKSSESAELATKPEAAMAAVKVETVPIEIRKMPRYLTLTGSVLADKQSEVAANVTGRLVSAPVERGQAVKLGQIIAVVDAREAVFSTAAAVAQAKAADSQVQLADADCKRADALLAKGASSQAEYDRQKTACSAQLFTANALRANADLAAKRAGDTTIRAPFDGLIGERYVNVGEYVQAQTKVASVFRIDPARVQISVPEQAVALIKAGQTLGVKVGAYEDRDFPATVRYIAPALRAATRDLLVEAVAKNADGALRPGMFATVQLLIGEGDEPTVPKDAIRIDGTVKRMFLARNGQAFEMVVRTGAEKDGRIAIAEAFAPTERVIVHPPAGLQDGAAVK
jgi:membrane fusion protein, multidrug efflux system